MRPPKAPPPVIEIPNFPGTERNTYGQDQMRPDIPGTHGSTRQR
jgi:hypothetical protein